MILRAVFTKTNLTTSLITGNAVYCCQNRVLQHRKHKRLIKYGSFAIKCNLYVLIISGSFYANYLGSSGVSDIGTLLIVLYPKNALSVL